MDFLWLVRTDMVLPAARSHSRTVVSMLPEMICGVAACAATDATVLVWPVKTWMPFLVRMSHTWVRHQQQQMPQRNAG